MKAWLMTLIFALVCGAMMPRANAQVVPLPVHERYGITFYGIELPHDGANLLLIIDVSKSMSRKDAARKTPGRRWDTLLDEVRAMKEAMHEAAKQRGIPFQVSVIFEGGDTPHRGEGPYNLADATAGDALMTLLSEQTFQAGGNFQTTFSETLWDVVARHNITYIIYLGDDDIGTAAESVRTAVRDWYTCDTDSPTAAQRKRRNQKRHWRKAWVNWRPTKRNQPTFRNAKRLPPPPKDVIFSCVAIGQSSELQQELAKMGNGKYVERTTKKKRSRKKAAAQ